MSRFHDRGDAGRELARRLAPWGDDPRAVVLGLARGGVIVAAQVAASLAKPFDVLVVRKLGLPGREEVAMGAIAEGGVVVLDELTVRSARVGEDALERVRVVEEGELARRVERYHAGRPRVTIAGAHALIVDDGVATGATARAACRSARASGADRVVLAIPVGPVGAARLLRGDADDVVVLVEASGAFAVGQFYDVFDQTSDAEVVECLDAARGRSARGAAAGDEPRAT